MGTVYLLAEPWRWLLGLSDETGRQFQQARLYFAGGWHIYVLVALLLLAACWFGVLYLKDGRRPSLWIKTPLLLLRLLALTALILMLLQPMLRLTKTETQRPNVLLLVDNSLSMERKDARLPADRSARIARAVGGSPAQMSRVEIASRLLNSPPSSLLSELSKRYQVRVYTFHGQAQAVPIPRPPARSAPPVLDIQPDPKGNTTQIGESLKRALDDLAGQPLAGALILSDGGNNLGEDPVAVAKQAREQGVTVSTLGIGDPTPTRDLAITEVLADQVVRKDNITQVFVGLSHRGYEGQTVSVTLRRGNETLGTQSARLGPAGRRQTVSFTYTPKQTGSFSHTVSATVLSGEITAENNRRRFLQRVISRKLKILYVEGEPRWEYRYLKNAILRDTQIAFSCYLVASGAQRGGEGNVPIYRFPQDEKSLFEFDILILGDVPRAHFTELQLRNIRRFVEDKGSSLVVIAGERHMPWEYRATPLEPIFPTELPSFPEQVKTAEPFQWELTPEGRQDPLLRLDDDPAVNARIWRELPGMYWGAGVPRARPGATVLVVNSARSNSYGKRVVLAVQPFGAGRCLISLTDSTWRWRWRVGDRYFYRYWGQMIRAMTPQETPGGNRYAQINADRAEYLLGDRVALNARLLDAFYRPVKAKQVTAVLRDENGVETPITLNASPVSPGLFSADFLAERVGKMQVSLASPANPAAPATASFLVQSVSLEQQQPELNETLLKRLAAAGGGGYYLPDETRRWLETLKAEDVVIRSESETELWDAPILLLLFVVPLSLEWLIRKRTGLL